VALPDLFTANQPIIERAITHVCRRHRLCGPEAEDFASATRLALIENDQARLRAFAGRSSLQTYLVVIITRLFQDWRNAQWGKWRPSAEAKRLGPLAIKLETMTVRDKLSFDEAVETLWTNHGVTEDRAALAEMCGRFPVRSGRTFTGEEALETVAAPNSFASAPLEQSEAAQAAGRAGSALETELAKLAAQDRLIIKMRFDSDFGVAEIAKIMQLEPKPLYRRIERILMQLRRSLEGCGLDVGVVKDIIENRGFDVAGWENRGEVRPFVRGGSPAGQEKVS
jgi:RNA polymerase sigma factor for flagellar operon FliA